MKREIHIPNLIGKTNKFIRVAGNSVILYLDCKPGQEYGFSIWLEPTWHMRNNSRVIVGSRQLQTEDLEEFNRLCEIINLFDSKQINNIQIDKVSNDISIMTDDFVIRTFVADPTDEYIWQIRDNGNRIMIEANPMEITSKEYSKK